VTGVLLALSLSAYGLTLRVALVHAMFALAAYVGVASGMFSFAPVVAGASGGFTYAVLARDHGLPLGAGMAVGVAAGSIVAGVAWFAVGRLEGHYLAMATFALVLITRVVILNLDAVTGGVNGVAVPGGVPTSTIVLILVAAAWVVARVQGARLGVAMRSVRVDRDAAASLGIDPWRTQRAAFVLAGGLGGLAGVLHATTLRHIGPGTYYLDLAFPTLAAVVLGGAYHWAGAIAGAALLTLLPELIGEVTDSGRHIVNGLILIVVMIHLPRGLIDPLRWPLLRRVPRQRSVAAPSPSRNEPEIEAAGA
jgi:branched-chain amino acid transport system permease protein